MRDTSRAQFHRSTAHDGFAAVVHEHCENPDVEAALAKFATLSADCSDSVLLDLAYEEYCIRRERGEAVPKTVFSGKFPDIRHSLVRRIEVHEFLDSGNEELTAATIDSIGFESVLFENFTVIEKLGKGALGHVFLCEQSGVGDRQTVVKVAFRGAYEADTLGRLSHPSIMPVYSVHNDEETQLSGVCMPFRGRSTLCDLLDVAWSDKQTSRSGDLILQAGSRWAQKTDHCEQNLEAAQDQDYIDTVLRLAIELADALKHAHKRGVRHDDIKPSNVLLTTSGHAQLLDFNLSSSDDAPTRVGGTLPYMSPEQLRGIESLDSEVDDRSDVYSLGVVLYELLAGRRPFEDPPQPAGGKEIVGQVNLICTTKPKPISDFNVNVDQGLNDIVLRCLESKPSDRFPSVEDFRQAAEVHREEHRRRLSGSSRSSKSGSMLVAAIVLIVALLGFLYSKNQSFGRSQEAIHSELKADSTSHSESKFALGRRLMAEGKWVAAIDAFEAHLPLDPGRTQACIAACYLYHGGGHLFNAREANELAIQHDFVNAAVLNNYAMCWSGAKEFDKIEYFLEQALLLQPDALEPRFNRGFLERSRYYYDMLNYIPKQGVLDSLYLRQELPEHGDVARLAAHLMGVAAREDATLLEPLYEALRVAKLGGYSSSLLKARQIFGWLDDDSQFQAVMRRASAKRARVDFVRTMDPLDENLTLDEHFLMDNRFMTDVTP